MQADITIWNVTSVFSDDSFAAVRKLPKDLEKVLVTTSSYFSPSQRHKTPADNTKRYQTPKTSSLVRKSFFSLKSDSSSISESKDPNNDSQLLAGLSPQQLQDYREGQKAMQLLDDNWFKPIPETHVPLNFAAEGSRNIQEFGKISYKMMSSALGFTFRANSTNVDEGYKWNNLTLSTIIDLGLIIDLFFALQLIMIFSHSRKSVT